jgi:hypothetical protein
MDKQTLEQLVANHHRVVVHGVRRRDEMQRWNYGTMTGGGPHQPNGGKTGDVYGPYACHSGATPDDIRALFQHAIVSHFSPSWPAESYLPQDNEILVEIGTSIIPTMHRDIIKVTNANETSCMGKYGLTTFTCSEYISTVHPDHDIGPAKGDHAQIARVHVIRVFSWSRAVLTKIGMNGTL